MNNKIKVLILDNSISSQLLLKNILEKTLDIEVIGLTKDWLEAIEIVKKSGPDILIADLKLIGVNDEVIIKITHYINIPILFLNNKAIKEERLLRDKLVNLEGLDIIDKSTVKNKEEFSKKIIKKIRTFNNCKVKNYAKREEQLIKLKAIILDKGKLFVVAIGASFGGRSALKNVFLQLSKDMDIAVIVVQHITTGFTQELVNSLANDSDFLVKIAQDGDRVKAGMILFAPPEFNMEIKLGDVVSLTKVSVGDKSSINTLFSSVSRIYKDNCMGILLTGMGDDGVEGIRDIKNAGGYTMAEAEKDCAIFGMPKIAIEKGYIDKVAGLNSMGKAIRDILSVKRKNG